MHNYHQLVGVLFDCARACEHCTASCLEGKDVKTFVNCIKLTRECADICILTSRLLERDSQFTNELLDICIKISRQCAEECEKFLQMEHCKKCAEFCRKVEETSYSHI